MAMNEHGLACIVLTNRALMQDAIKQWGHKIPADEVMAIMAAADVDGDGFIDYNEFVAATMNVNQLEKEDLIYKAFQEFDEDGSNSISIQELEKVPFWSCLLCTVFKLTALCNDSTIPALMRRTWSLVQSDAVGGWPLSRFIFMNVARSCSCVAQCKSRQHLVPRR